MIRFLSTCERPSPCSSPYILPIQNNWPFFEHISLAHASWLLCTHLYCNLVPLEKTSLTSLKRPSCSLFNSYVHYACCLASVMSNSLGPRLLCPWDSPGKNTGVGCRALLQGPSQCRDQTHVSYISSWAGGFLTTSTTWEAQKKSDFFPGPSCFRLTCKLGACRAKHRAASHSQQLNTASLRSVSQ